MTGANNIGVGPAALLNMTSGHENTGFGVQANNNNQDGIGNNAIGFEANFSNVSGNYNNAMGSFALIFNTGSNNVGVGSQSLYFNTSGSQNTAIGTASGQHVTTGSNNTFIGFAADTTSSSIVNSTAIGNGASVTQNNQMVFGNANITQTLLHGNVGIGTTSPTTGKLVIVDTTLAGSAALAGSVLDLAQTWNTTGTPTALKLTVTDTASNAASLLLQLKVATVSQFKVSKAGVGTFAGIVSAAGFNVGATAGIDATVTYVDTLLGAKTLTFSKGILVSQV
jgi:hypothetical protein